MIKDCAAWDMFFGQRSGTAYDHEDGTKSACSEEKEAEQLVKLSTMNPRWLNRIALSVHFHWLTVTEFF